ncbi:MAG: hypothetical protein MZW92_22375 [Comamonadaceae bacterium]|nr:hypothetical protein [Comamonadaceae bacterium]
MTGNRTLLTAADLRLGTGGLRLGQRGTGRALPRRPHLRGVLGEPVRRPGLQARPARAHGIEPARRGRLGEEPGPGVSGGQRRLRPGAQRLLRVSRRHRGLDRVPRDHQRDRRAAGPIAPRASSASRTRTARRASAAARAVHRDHQPSGE